MGNFSTQLKNWFSTVKRNRIALVILLTIGVFLLLPSFREKVNILSLLSQNISFEILSFILTFVVLESGIERISTLEIFNIREHPRLPIDKFIRAVKESSGSIKLLDSYTLLINEDKFWNDFRAALEKAVKQGANIQILLCHPEGDGAKQRADEIVTSIETNYNDIASLLGEFRKGLLKLYHLIELIRKSGYDGTIEVRLMDSLPSFALHLVDNVSYWNFFPKEKLATFDQHLQVETNTRHGRFIVSHFDALWIHTKNTLDDYIVQEIRNLGYHE